MIESKCERIFQIVFSSVAGPQDSGGLFDYCWNGRSGDSTLAWRVAYSHWFGLPGCAPRVLGKN